MQPRKIATLCLHGLSDDETEMLLSSLRADKTGTSILDKIKCWLKNTEKEMSSCGVAVEFETLIIAKKQQNTGQ